MAASGNELVSSDGCVLCGLQIASCLTNAHAHEGTDGYPNRTFRLCWSCHRMYDHDIIATNELLEAEMAWGQGDRPDATGLHRQIEADLAGGLRTVNKARQHKGAAQRAGRTRRLSNRAKRAWATRRSREKQT